VEVQLRSFSASTLDGGEWLAPCLGRFIPGERAPDTHWIGGWVDLRVGLDAVVGKKISSPCGEWNSDHPARSLVTPLTDLSRLLRKIPVSKKTWISFTLFVCMGA
jgi:hypothetical protein